MDKLYTFNSTQLDTASFTAVAVSAGRINISTTSGAFPGIIGRVPVLMARVFYSWTALTAPGANALVANATALPSSAGGVAQTSYLYVHGVTSYGTAHAASSTGVVSTLAVNGASAGSEWFEICGNAYSSATGALVPMPAYWCPFFADNTANDFTAGTFTVDKVELYG